MNITCEMYYSLGGYCDNDCNNCLGDKEVYECTEDFEVLGGTLLDKVKVKKGGRFWILFINNDHALLRDVADNRLYLERQLFDKYFTDDFIMEAL